MHFTVWALRDVGNVFPEFALYMLCGPHAIGPLFAGSKNVVTSLTRGFVREPGRTCGTDRTCKAIVTFMSSTLLDLLIFAGRVVESNDLFPQLRVVTYHPPPLTKVRGRLRHRRQLLGQRELQHFQIIHNHLHPWQHLPIWSFLLQQCQQDLDICACQT